MPGTTRSLHGGCITTNRVQRGLRPKVRYKLGRATTVSYFKPAEARHSSYIGHATPNPPLNTGTHTRPRSALCPDQCQPLPEGAAGKDDERSTLRRPGPSSALGTDQRQPLPVGAAGGDEGRSETHTRTHTHTCTRTRTRTRTSTRTCTRTRTRTRTRTHRHNTTCHVVMSTPPGGLPAPQDEKPEEAVWAASEGAKEPAAASKILVGREAPQLKYLTRPT